jgi:flagellar biosynthesis protein FliP
MAEPVVATAAPVKPDGMLNRLKTKAAEDIKDGITMSKAAWITLGCAIVVIWFIVMVIDAAEMKRDKYPGLKTKTSSKEPAAPPMDEKALREQIATQVRSIRSTWAFMKNDTRMADALKSLRFWLLLLLFPFILILFYGFHKVYITFKIQTVTAMAIAMGGIVTGICLFIWIQAARGSFI